MRSSPSAPTRPTTPPRWPATLAWFVGLTLVLSVLLYVGPVTPSPGDLVPSVFMAAFLGGLATVIVRSGFQARRHRADTLSDR